jgi:leucyl aminopeptidase
MIDCLVKGQAQSRPVQVVGIGDAADAIAALPAAQRRWLETTGFTPQAGAVGLLAGSDGGVSAALLVVGSPAGPWDAAGLPAALREGDWRLDDPKGLLAPAEAALAFALASYRFERYRKREQARPRLVVSDEAAHRRAMAIASSICLSRDLVNTPANDLGPEELQAAVAEVAEAQGARLTATVGEELLARNYPTIHAVGRASTRAPRLLDLVWGDPGAPKVTLVGKGVCFDTGGLDIKPSSGMLMMKKDMGGAGLMLGLARAVMALGLPVRLRLLVPAVENSISGSAFRPGDVLRTRKGLSVEIGNTDAEGRLVLCDALAEADTEQPEILLDAATLTGAARVALGPELPALFTPDDALAQAILAQGVAQEEPLGRLPLHAPYRKLLDSAVADINNVGSKPFAGAITAALFLKEFVTETRGWAHLDIFAWNDDARPGRPKGAEATGLRPLLAMLEERYGGR